MHSIKVLAKETGIEVVLFAEVAPWMRKDLSTLIVGWITSLDVLTQARDVVNALLSNEDSAALDANQAESLLMFSLHVAPQALLVGEVRPGRALFHQAIECTQFHSFNLGRAICIVDRVICAVHIALQAHCFVEVVPG